MSTKSTIACGEKFHLYHEVFESEFVYLGLEDVNYEILSNEIRLEIPVYIYEYIRQFKSMDFDLVDLSDEEIESLEKQFTGILSSYGPANTRDLQRYVIQKFAKLVDKTRQPCWVAH